MSPFTKKPKGKGKRKQSRASERKAKRRQLVSKPTPKIRLKTVSERLSQATKLFQPQKEKRINRRTSHCQENDHMAVSRYLPAIKNIPESKKRSTNGKQGQNAGRGETNSARPETP